MDGVSMFGFVVGFFTIVALLYRRELHTGFPLLPVLIAALSVYGFLQGAWPLGFVLLMMAAAELASWWNGFDPILQQNRARPHRRFVSLYEPESRMSRLFEQR